MIKHVNLQLFAEGEPAAHDMAPAQDQTQATSIEPAQTGPSQQASSDPPVNPTQRLMDLWDKANSPEKADTPQNQAPDQSAQDHSQDQVQDQSQDQDGGQNQETPDTPDQQAQQGKILNKYNSVNDLVKAYQSMQSAWTRDRQTLLELQKAIDQLKQEKAGLEAKLQTPQQPQSEAEDNLANLSAEELLEKFYEDPKSVLAKIAESVVESKIKPLESKLAPVVEHTEVQMNLEKWNNAVAELSAVNPDMVDYIDTMKEYIVENNLHDSKEPQKVLRDAYSYAKAKAFDTKIAEFTAKIEQLEAQLKTAKEDGVKEYLARIQNANSQVPKSIAGNSNSGAPANPPVSVKGKPMSEIHKIAADFIFGSQ